MLLYVGPDQMMPAMSLLATIMGFLMIFWGKVVNLFRKIFGLSKPIDPAPEAAAGSEPPKQS